MVAGCRGVYGGRTMARQRWRYPDSREINRNAFEGVKIPVSLSIFYFLFLFLYNSIHLKSQQKRFIVSFFFHIVFILSK